MARSGFQQAQDDLELSDGEVQSSGSEEVDYPDDRDFDEEGNFIERIDTDYELDDEPPADQPPADQPVELPDLDHFEVENFESKEAKQERPAPILDANVKRPICPITHKTLKSSSDLVGTPDGYVYEREAITTALIHRERSPMNPGMRLTSLQFFPPVATKEALAYGEQQRAKRKKLEGKVEEVEASNAELSEELQETAAENDLLNEKLEDTQLTLESKEEENEMLADQLEQKIVESAKLKMQLKQKQAEISLLTKKLAVQKNRYSSMWSNSNGKRAREEAQPAFQQNKRFRIVYS
jgi:hypothetical protein